MQDYKKVFNAYTQKAVDIINNWKAEPTVHLTDIVRSVMMHRDDIQPGGHFVRAVCANDLFEAINRADDTCREYLNIIVSAYRYGHINESEYV
jgi:hypothetical protein